MRALITGISGFVGGHLAEHLLARGDDVLGCAPDGHWTPASPPDLADNVELLAWDLAADLPDAVRRRLTAFRPEAIYHLAAISVPRQCGEEAPTAAALALNVEGTRRVMALSAELPTRPRVLMTSSSHVYSRPRAASPTVDEQWAAAPPDAYGRTKWAAEAIVLKATAAGGDAVISRSFQHTGPRQGPEMMLPQWVRQFVEQSGPVEVQTRDAMIDLSDVRDVVRAYRLLVERGERGAIYNVGSGAARRSGDVLDILRRLAGPDRPIVETRPGPKQDPIADIGRLVRATGWRPTIPIEQTVADTLAWWRGK